MMIVASICLNEPTQASHFTGCAGDDSQMQAGAQGSVCDREMRGRLMMLAQ